MDALPKEMRDRIYGKKTKILYKEFEGAMIPNDATQYMPLTKTYLSKLSIDQQYKQLRVTI